MIDILDMNVVERIIGDINSADNVIRKRNEYINYEIGCNQLKKYVFQKIVQMYPKTHPLFTISDYSLVKKIRNKKAKAYKDAPMRKLDVEEESSEYVELLKAGRFNDAMKEIDKIYNQHGYAGLFMEKGDLNQAIKFYPLRPYEFDIVKDDNGELICLILSYPGSMVTNGQGEKVIAGDRADDDLNEVVYSFWTNDLHITYTSKIDKEGNVKGVKYVELPDNPNNVNPWGIIPFSYIPFDFNEDYPASSALPEQTIELNSLLSTYLTSANMQIGQLVVSYPSDQPIETLTSGMMTAMRLPQSKDPQDKPSTANYISPTPNLAGHREAIITLLTLILDENDINSNQVVNGVEKFTSALDRMISQADVQQIIEDNQETYTRFEQECFAIINAMSMGYFKSTSVTPIYVKPKLLMSDTDKLANIEKRMAMGMIEDYEKLILDNPNLTVEEAKAKLVRINEEKKKDLPAEVIVKKDDEDLDEVA